MDYPPTPARDTVEAPGSRRPTPMALRLAVPALVVAVLASLVPAVATAARYSEPVEDYASYEPQVHCRPKAKPGTLALAGWIDRRFAGGHPHAHGRSCASGGTSEHKEGRAIDWTMDARKKRDRREVRAFLDRLFAEDNQGNQHALARRMGVMYVIWNDHMYASYRGFEKRDYLSSGCRRKRSCSATLRHRDHVHISLSRRGGKGRTSWYAGRVEQ